MSSAQQAAPAAQTGMRRIPIPLESYEHANVPLSAKRLVNMYAEKQPDDARAPVALIPAPGLIELVTVGTGPIKVINSDLPGLQYVVSGSEFYRVRPSAPGSLTFAVDDLGAIGEPAGATDTVTVAVGQAAVAWCACRRMRSPAGICQPTRSIRSVGRFRGLTV